MGFFFFFCKSTVPGPYQALSEKEQRCWNRRESFKVKESSPQNPDPGRHSSPSQCPHDRAKKRPGVADFNTVHPANSVSGSHLACTQPVGHTQCPIFLRNPASVPSRGASTVYLKGMLFKYNVVNRKHFLRSGKSSLFLPQR